MPFMFIFRYMKRALAWAPLLAASFFLILSHILGGSNSPDGSKIHALQHSPPIPDHYAAGTDGRYEDSVFQKRDEVDLHHYICKGERALTMLTQDPPSTRVFTRQELTEVWSLSQYDGTVSAHFVPVFDQLGIPHGPRDVQSVFAQQDEDFIDQRGHRQVSFPIFCDLMMTS